MARIPRHRAVEKVDEAHHAEETTADNQSRYRMHATEAGSQPSFGKRKQLIEDELCDPCEHFRRAKKMERPFDSMQSLKEDHAGAIEAYIGMLRNY